MLAVVVVALTVSCADNDTERRFANDPATAQLPTMAASPTATSRERASPSAARPAASPGPVLAPRSAPGRIYFEAGRELWTMTASDGKAARIFVESRAAINLLAPSPTADRVAVLLTAGTSAVPTTTLVVLTADGRELRRVPDVQRFARPTPGRTVALVARSLGWSPRGDQLLVAFAGGGLVNVPLAGTPQALVDGGQAPSPSQAAWSPTGDAIAFLNTDPAGHVTGLYVAHTGAAPLDPVPVLAPSPNRKRTIARFAWLPDGSGLLFSEAPVGRGSNGGDLFRVSLSGEDKRLVASAGVAAPVAQIGTFATSPDGSAIAYTVFVPGTQGLTFSSLWVQAVGARDGLRLGVPAGATVTDVWWTASGLVWRAVTDGAGADGQYDGGRFSLYRSVSGSAPVRLLDVVPTERGTPAAKTGASPTASPVASPAAIGANPLEPSHRA